MKSYFTIEELCYSDTALMKRIKNLPNKQEESNLNRLIRFLNPLREAWGSPIKINSGFRNSELNKVVGGTQTSAHLTGNAIDMIPSNGKFEEFKQFIIEYTKDKEYDECIIEKNSKGSEWIHFALYSSSGLQRKKQFNLNVK